MHGLEGRAFCLLLRSGRLCFNNEQYQGVKDTAVAAAASSTPRKQRVVVVLPHINTAAPSRRRPPTTTTTTPPLSIKRSILAQTHGPVTKAVSVAIR